jgi:hypothetical protein
MTAPTASKLEAIMPANIDSTMLTCFRSCPEKMRLEFIYGLRPQGISVDLHAGAAFATGIETVRKAVYQKGKTLTDALMEGYAAYSIAWGDFEIPDYKRTAKTRENCWFAIEEYFRKWPPLTDHFQPYYVNGKPTFEWTFAIPLEPAADPHKTILTGDGEPLHLYGSYDPADHADHFPLHPSGQPWLYSGRFDMLGSYEGLPAFGDEKTTGGSISTGWDDKWRLRNQFLGYTWALQEHGMAAQGGVVRGIAILKTKIDLVESYKMYSDELISRWYEQLRRDLWRLRAAWDTGYFDLNLADTCTAYGNCMFMNTCASSAANKSSWMNDFEVRRWNPLHKNPIAEAKEAA